MELSKNIGYKTTSAYFGDVLDKNNFNAYVDCFIIKPKNLEHVSIAHPNGKAKQRFFALENPNTIPFNRQAAIQQLEEMTSSILLNGFRLFFWYFNKNMRVNIQGLWVDTQSVKMVKELISQNHKVVFIPLYKSYLDFFVQMFVTCSQKIKLGFTFGNYEDTPRISVIDKWLTSCGYIFSRRKLGQSLQSNYINSEILKNVILNNQVTTLYQNYERFRTGKLHRKLQADMSIRWLLETFTFL